MESTWLALPLAALVGAAFAASACRWWFGRALVLMQKRLEQSEAGRHAAHDRSQQARHQIAQLTKMVADLQKRQKLSMEAQQQQRRAQLERALDAAVPAHEAPALPANGFADT